MCFFSEPEFRERISSIRLGSPVQVDGKNTFITRLPDNNKPIVGGYSVFGDAMSHSIKEIQPIPLDECFFSRHDGLFKKISDGVYEYSTKDHRITVSIDGQCWIDSQECGIIYRHELKSILEDICGITISLYDGIASTRI